MSGATADFTAIVETRGRLRVSLDWAPRSTLPSGMGASRCALESIISRRGF